MWRERELFNKWILIVVQRVLIHRCVEISKKFKALENFGLLGKYFRFSDKHFFKLLYLMLLRIARPFHFLTCGTKWSTYISEWNVFHI